MKKILLENALESWASAIYYCDEIIAGKATLANKKHFVNSLQNAIELFVKQLQLYHFAIIRLLLIKLILLVMQFPFISSFLVLYYSKYFYFCKD